MKKFAMFSMLLSLTLFTVGCAPKDEAPVTPPPAADGAAADGEADHDHAADGHMEEEEGGAPAADGEPAAE